MLNFSQIETYIPPRFKDGRPIERIILICDVDGVIRKSTEANIDPQVLASIKELISTGSKKAFEKSYQPT